MGASSAVGMLFDAVSGVKSFIDVFIIVYTLVILAYVISSWIPMPYSPWLNRIQRFLYDVCEPYLRLFRRILPTLGPLDLSPIVAVGFLYLLRFVIDGLLNRIH
jgi:uncharacterized protein YggT (Ycf19 family)